MKTLLLILSLIISINVYASDYANQYKNAPATDNYIMLQTDIRIRELKSKILELDNLIKFKKATDFQVSLNEKLKSEYKYLTERFGTK